MNRDKSAVIIGAGIGGITTSVFLARQGYKVSVYEKNSGPGGRCGQIFRDGHRFDTGATIFLMPSIYTEVFESLGLNLKDCFDSVPLETVYTIHFNDETKIAFSSDKNKLYEQLEKIEKGSSRKAQLYLKRGYRFFKLAHEKLLSRNFYNLFDFATFSNAALLIRLKAFVRHIRYVRRFFKSQHLQMAFTFQNIYVGQSPFQASALFSMLPAAELTEGSLFPVGGMYSITKRLIQEAEKMGVKFNYKKEVVKICTGKDKVTGIEFTDGTLIKAGLIVANADLPYVYRKLLPDIRVSKRIDKLKSACSAMVFHWGLDKTYNQLTHHSIFLSGEYAINLNRIFKNHSISENPSFYVHAPMRSDSTAAPEGGDTLSIIIPSGYYDEKNNVNWDELKKTVRVSVLNRLEKAGLKDIEKHIKFELCFLPQDWYYYYNLTKGSTFGSIAHHIFQMGYLRPHNRHNRYHNLYFVGSSTHPGGGVPLVLLSAKLTSDRIIKDSGND